MSNTIKKILEALESCTVNDKKPGWHFNEVKVEQAHSGLLKWLDEFIAKLEAEKFTEEQGMDNEMDNYNAGIDYAIKTLKQATAECNSAGRCGICKCILDTEDPKSLNCGGDCLGCMEEIEKKK